MTDCEHYCIQCGLDEHGYSGHKFCMGNKVKEDIDNYMEHLTALRMWDTLSGTRRFIYKLLRINEWDVKAMHDAKLLRRTDGH